MTPKINWNPDQKQLRWFGAVLLIGFSIICGILVWRGQAGWAKNILFVVVPISLLALVLPNLAKPFYLLWMGIGFVVGSVMSRVVMSLIFFGVLTPIALIFKIIGRDALGRKNRSGNVDSYWVDHPVMDDKKNYEHLF